MKLCIVGNSHVAALRDANGPAPMLGPHHVDFYAILGGRQLRPDVRGGRLRPADETRPVLTTVPGAHFDGLRIADFDALVVSACGMFAARNEHFEPDRSVHPMGAAACVEWASLAAEGTEAPRLVSAAVFDAVVEGFVRDHASVALPLLLAEHFDGPILLQAWPAPDRRLRSDAGWHANAWFGAGGAAMWRRFFAAQRSTLMAVAAELGPRGVFLDYPLPEPMDDGFMDGRWCTADPWHANAQYGALVIDQIIRALAS